MLKILIAHDHRTDRNELRRLIAGNRDWKLCGEEKIGAAAYAVAMTARPDVVIFDIDHSVVEGISLARLFRDDLPTARTLLFTSHEDADTVTSAAAAGIKGYVLRSEGERQLAVAVERIASDRTSYSQAVLDVIVDAAGRRLEGDHSTFTPAELEVTGLIAKGETNAAAARQLGIGIKALQANRASALRKAGANNNFELIRFAIRHKLIAFD
jgi:DNA-binding NarL/FixJ family response regulator